MKKTSLIIVWICCQSILAVAPQVKSTSHACTHWFARSSAYVPVPFYYQITTYYCGPAALEMVFDYYGEDISQMEIADVARTSYLEGGTFTDEMRRAAHFSNLSISFGDEMPGGITGYSAREVGYAAFEQWELTVDDVKNLINNGEPLIVLMWWSTAKVYGHYRVVVGYTETHIIMHDPWNKDLWGGTWGGPDTSMTYSTFLDLWAYSANWGLWIHPWNIELQIPSIAYDGENFTVTAHISYPCSTLFNVLDYPASLCNATINLQQGLELASGETTRHPLGNINAGNTVQTSWAIRAYETGFHNISVTATGMVEGSVWAHGTYPSYNYEDAIGVLHVKSTVFIRIAGDVDGDGDVDGFDLTRMCVAYGSTSGDPAWDEPCDINFDDIIDGFDLTPACGNYGKTL